MTSVIEINVLLTFCMCEHSNYKASARSARAHPKGERAFCVSPFENK